MQTLWSIYLSDLKLRLPTETFASTRKEILSLNKCLSYDRFALEHQSPRMFCSLSYEVSEVMRTQPTHWGGSTAVITYLMHENEYYHATTGELS
jgi:hypothetical protein